MRNVKTLIAFIALTFAISYQSKAQYVTLTDADFVKWIHRFSPVPQCLNGNKLDTTCPGLLTITGISILTHDCPIHNLDGFHYFKNLTNLSIYGPADDTTGVGLEQSSTLPLPVHLKQLTITCTRLSQIPVLPGGLEMLYCFNNKVDSLPTTWPNTLTQLDCKENHILNIFTLPPSLTDLYCGSNLFTTLPELPPTLLTLDCGNNPQLKLFPLPQSLLSFYCGGNEWDTLPVLPNSLRELYFSDNQLSYLPHLPGSLTRLYCNHNKLSIIPPTILPASLIYLDCKDNKLSTLPAIPASLTSINCSGNQITELPPLPDIMYFFDCSNNPNLHCLPVLKTMQCGTYYNEYGELYSNICLNFTGTGVQCLPNYGNISYSTPAVNAFPLCDSINPNNCTLLLYNSINDPVSIPLQVYPNPCIDFVTLKVDESEKNASAELLDITGKLLGNYPFQNSSLQLETSNLSAGVYLVKIYGKQGKTTTRRLIKQ